MIKIRIGMQKGRTEIWNSEIEISQKQKEFFVVFFIYFLFFKSIL